MKEKRSKLMSVADVAERLNLSVQRVKQLIYNEQLLAEKVGNQWIIRESDLKDVEDRPTGRPRKRKTDAN
jgi:excisionase family DNA binding protein